MKPDLTRIKGIDIVVDVQKSLRYGANEYHTLRLEEGPFGMFLEPMAASGPECVKTHRQFWYNFSRFCLSRVCQ
jgi:hypothetical protein